MKIRHFILAAYVFLLALYPCRDSDLHAGAITDTAAVVSDHDHSHSGVELDICTPFCLCSCCSAHIRLSVPNDIEGAQLQHNTVLISRYIEHPVLDLTRSIWQPPRI